jgi:transcriptional regulator with XRE-family HTH domain
MTSEVMSSLPPRFMIRTVRSTNSHSPPPPAPSAHVGALLREWRAARRLSQLNLALDVGTSTRHLSCVETGKAQPSRDMVARLADALGMPLRERNALLIAAGYAPEYRETALTTPEMAPQRRAIEVILAHHEPYPAFVMNRHWDVLMTNQALTRFIDSLKAGGAMHSNIVRQVFDPNDMRPFVANWEEVAQELVRHLHADVAAAPSDAKARALLEEVLAYPDVPAHWRTREPARTPLPILTSAFRRGEIELRFFSTLTMFATPRDVTLDELRIECMFPADEATAQECRALAK